MLFAAGCSTAPRPSINPTEAGNAYRLLLPAGTTLTLPDDANAAQIRAVAHNEVQPGQGRSFTLAAPLQLVSPAYIAERNADEITLVQIIADLRAELSALRNK